MTQRSAILGDLVDFSAEPALERALVLKADDGALSLADLPPEVVAPRREAPPSVGRTLAELVAALEREQILLAMKRSRGVKAQAAEALGITAHRLKALGMIDKVVSEPVGGAHRDTRQMASQLKRALVDALRQVSDLKTKDLLQRRYDRLQSYGKYADTKDR
jgi:hypothetical protein